MFGYRYRLDEGGCRFVVVANDSSGVACDGGDRRGRSVWVSAAGRDDGTAAGASSGCSTRSLSVATRLTSHLMSRLLLLLLLLRGARLEVVVVLTLLH